MKTLIVAAFLLSSVTAFAAETGTLRGVEGIDKILKSSELLRCKSESDIARKLTKSCASFNSKAIQQVYTLAGDIEDKLIFETTTDQEESRLVIKDLENLYATMRDLWQVGKDGIISHHKSSLLIEARLKKQRAQLRRSKVMTINCVSPRNQKLVTGSIHSKLDKESKILFLGKTKPVAFRIDEIEFEVNDRSDLKLRKPELMIEFDKGIMFITDMIKINGKLQGIGEILGKGIPTTEDLRCTLTGSGY